VQGNGLVINVAIAPALVVEMIGTVVRLSGNTFDLGEEDGLGGSKPFFLYPQPRQDRQGEDQEVTAAHAGVQETDLGGMPGPAVEGPRRGAPSAIVVLEKAQVVRQRHAPRHPGEILREDFLAPLSLRVHALAQALHVPATRLHETRQGVAGRDRMLVWIALVIDYGQRSRVAVLRLFPDGRPVCRVSDMELGIEAGEHIRGGILGAILEGDQRLFLAAGYRGFECWQFSAKPLSR
jgi:hypothetical protein